MSVMAFPFGSADGCARPKDVAVRECPIHTLAPNVIAIRASSFHIRFSRQIRYVKSKLPAPYPNLDISWRVVLSGASPSARIE